MFGNKWLDIKHIATQRFDQHQVQAENKENAKATHYWLFVWWIHLWPMDAPHNEPVLRRVVASHNIIIHRSRTSADGWYFTRYSYT